MFESILDPIFSPLLELGHFWAILILAFVLTLVITIVYKYTTDQKLMKSLKAEMKSLQKEAKKLSSNPSKAMPIQKKIMDKNMQYMKHSFKPTLYTFLPIIIIFGWLNAHMAFLPIMPDTDFSVSAEFKEGTFGQATLEIDVLSNETFPESGILSNLTQDIPDDGLVTWKLNGPAGEYDLSVIFDNRKFSAPLTISNSTYAKPESPVKDSLLKNIIINNEKVRPLKEIGLNFNLNWIWTYIIFSLIFSLSIRKLMKLS